MGVLIAPVGVVTLQSGSTAMTPRNKSPEEESVGSRRRLLLTRHNKVHVFHIWTNNGVAGLVSSFNEPGTSCSIGRGGITRCRRATGGGERHK